MKSIEFSEKNKLWKHTKVVEEGLQSLKQKKSIKVLPQWTFFRLFNFCYINLRLTQTHQKNVCLCCFEYINRYNSKCPRSSLGDYTPDEREAFNFCTINKNGLSGNFSHIKQCIRHFCKDTFRTGSKMDASKPCKCCMIRSRGTF